MEKAKKIKISLALIYGVIISLFLWAFFSKFSLNDLISYEFIKSNRDYLTVVKESNYFLVSILFLIFTIIWVLFLGFGAPIFLLGGFIFGKWVGTLLVVFGLSIGATILYIFANYFLKDLIKNKFSSRFSNLNEKFKQNEFSFFLIYRFVGGIPFFISNILPTLFNVKIRNFFFGSLIGMTPQLFVGTTLGSGIEKVIDQNKEVPTFLELFTSSEIYIPVLGFIFLVILGFFLKRFFYDN
jgi:uncharacterized membrane protein YdjX (TVP38/TMEM64 family)